VSLYYVRPTRLHCISYIGPVVPTSQSLGPPVSIVYSTSAQPSPLYIVHRPSRLHFTQSLGPAVSTSHSPSAHPPLLKHIPRPTRLRCIWHIGPAISTSHSPSAHPSPLYIVHRPSRLHFTQSLGPPVSVVTHAPALHSLPIIYSSTTFLYYIPPAHPYLTHLMSRPIHLHHTLSTIHYYCYTEYNLYHLLYYIPLAQPFPSGTHHILGPLLYNATIITIGPRRMARPSGYIVTLGWPSEMDEFTEWALK
jgi:hypothetical protein